LKAFFSLNHFSLTARCSNFLFWPWQAFQAWR